ncbi:MAG: GrdX family protein [Thermacetogeniaceae bacterium]|nr:hypothetical protein [Syntrophomonadaceae bacterium]
MQNTIVTNNPIVRDKYSENVLFIDGSVEQLLIKVRDLVHEGYELITHPLPASLRIMFSPYRSVIIGQKRGTADPLHVEIAEESVLKYKRQMSNREVDIKHNKDYQQIDLILLESALGDVTRV